MDDSWRLWTKCSELLQDQMTESTWRTWFGSATPVASRDGLTLAVPSTLVKERIESRFLPTLERTVSDVAGGPTAIRVEVRTASAPDGWPVEDSTALLDATNTDNALPGGDLDAGRFPQSIDSRGDHSGPVADSPQVVEAESRLTDRYTFAAFVIGSSNRFAHAAALSVAETPAKTYNPLFIHGEAGLGKTHLLHAIGNYVRAHYPSYNVTYVSTETFTNEFIESIRRGSNTEFKRRYRECDVLLVDDIQFIEGKESTQEEFFHTFNSLHGASKQIVITSDRHPKAIATLENRLRSRFLSGLITDVQPPDLETRLAILRKKAASEGISMSHEVMEFIATNVTDNIRELEGAFIRASAFSSLSGTPLDRHSAEHVLSDIVTESETPKISPATIIELTAKVFGFSPEEICSASRRRPVTTARQIAMYLCRELTDYSYPMIGAEFGGRDHTTVIHAVGKVSAMMMQRKQIYEQVNGLIHQAKASG